ncbi:translation initiation factor IF-3 [Candidatus Campbellbacteria bacterium RIFOXYC2_FULL_35_25]|uniref:Translation initiation factor IF-3 n=1 Tax=Candidatus Campbellbacteria bacterium RIFOXYC2_FULL_35_25 TaxID=1797582 RepID=A0A1F5EJW5_9BACT|nr:MAG: translation initiation factor IF-3 [Candidatus Campbellbacteria bacterium RIFOXYC2_FULL_35_25]
MAYKPQTRINEAIRSEEVRIIGPNAENMGVMKTRDALLKAREMNLDLIETSPNTNPPIAKIMDYGKFQYDEKKKAKVAKAKSHVTETKVVQVKVGTGEHDLELKAKNISKWLKEGNRIKLDLFLIGRTKYMQIDFLKERMDRVLHLITEEYKVADGPKKSPKGLTMVLEKK